MNENAITDVCIVADPSNCPEGYYQILRTYDSGEDADLWKDNFFKRKTRYLCFLKTGSLEGKNVLTDISIIGEKDLKPEGYVHLELTTDTKEKAMKKRQVCVRYLSSSLTQSAISDIIFLAQTKRPPAGYTLIGDINNIQLCYKMSAIKRDKPKTTAESSMKVQIPQTPQLQANIQPQSPPGKTYNPMSGVPWKINPRLEELHATSKIAMNDIEIKSANLIENQYTYSFQVEKAASLCTR